MCHMISWFNVPRNFHVYSNIKMMDSVRYRFIQQNRSVFVSSNKSKSYQEAVKTLNSLQSSAALIQERKNSHPDELKLEKSLKYLKRTGLTLQKLDELNVIHVAGTKGKGSVCALCESILRNHGLKTGFFSSPHLVEVRERIRINGSPLSYKEFTSYFWDVYNSLYEQKDNESDMPHYFKFLTIMAFNVFYHENVDVAIIEVGIGGEFDCTNILRKVVAVGITSLGLDHTNLLGDTLEKIAWQKAGIMKPYSVAVTAPQISESVLQVLQQRSVERQCPLFLAPHLDDYEWEDKEVNFGVKVQGINASLALQLVNIFLNKEYRYLLQNENKFGMFQSYKFSNTIPVAQSFPITKKMMFGLRNCSWPGRTQILSIGDVKYFLDGAHTVESMVVCSQWFKEMSCKFSARENTKRVLIFNSTGQRSSKSLLSQLLDCDFDICIFCPNSVTASVQPSSDQANFNSSLESQMSKCKENYSTWVDLSKMKTANVMLFSCVQDVANYVETVTCRQNIHVMVTGSLHLVGTVLSVIDPDLSKSAQEHRILK